MKRKMKMILPDDDEVNEIKGQGGRRRKEAEDRQRQDIVIISIRNGTEAN